MAYRPPNPPNRIREIRERAGLSQNEIAKGIGASSFQQIWKLEHQVNPLTHGWMVGIAKVLDVRPAALIDPDVELLPNAQGIGNLANDRLLGELLELWDIIKPDTRQSLLEAVRGNAALIRGARVA